MEFSLIIPAFIAGLLTFLAPCTLPLVPGYLAFISGVSLDDPQARRKIFSNGLVFVIGFSLVFIGLGTLIGIVGQTLIPYRLWLTRIGGLFVILFGLMMLNIIRIPLLNREKHFQVPAVFQRGTPASSLLLGSAFAFGWTPCVGPILGSILVLASTSTTVWQGAFLLLIFSLGLAVPFLAIAAGLGSTARFIDRYSTVFGWLNRVGGILLIGLGLLLLTNNMVQLIAWGYRLLQFINYDRLLNYL